LATLKEKLNKIKLEQHQGCAGGLRPILSGGSALSVAGFPVITKSSFDYFIKNVPHLFQDGLKILLCLDELELKVQKSPEFSDEEKKEVQRVSQVIGNMVYSAGITAPSDLWLVWQALSTLAELGLTKYFLSCDEVSVSEIVGEFELNEKQLRLDLDLLASRGYLIKNHEKYCLNDLPHVRELLSEARVIRESFRGDWVRTIAMKLGEKDLTLRKRGLLESFMTFDYLPSEKKGWVASYYEIQVGYRLVPLVLALRSLNFTQQLTQGVRVQEVARNLSPQGQRVLFLAGLVDKQGGVTVLGDRVFHRGPGPFGICHAYHPYMKRHFELLKEGLDRPWVVRGENVAASQDANAGAFKMMNDKLDQFCQEYGFKYNVYIEHAVGQGEALRQRFIKDGEKQIQYFGADLEEAAINRALENQKMGKLPENTVFVRQADIGEPDVLINSVRRAGFDTKGSVMVVGNGFHEIRNQTNEKMVEVFKKYSEAGILLIFAEETGLRDEEILSSAFNTYHAGFRYCHQMSGQGLRSCYDSEDDENYSWHKCATQGGYQISKKYTTRTRPIFPFQGADVYNPSISVNYFCVPEALARLGEEG